MSDLAALIAQLTGKNSQPATDPALAAVKLARASLDALVLKLGQTVDAKVVGQLTGGITQFSSKGESFVLKLETQLPTGTAVTIKVTPTPQGTPSVSVTVPPTAAQPARVLPVQTPTAPLVEAGGAGATTAPVSPQAQPAQQPAQPRASAQPVPASVTPQNATAQAEAGELPIQQANLTTAKPIPSAPSPLPQPVVQQAAVPASTGTNLPLPAQPTSQPQATAATPAQSVPARGQAAAQAPLPISSGVTAGSVHNTAQPATGTPVPQQAAPAVTPAVPPNVTSPVSPPPATPASQPPTPALPQSAPNPGAPASAAQILSQPLPAPPQQPGPTQASPYPVQLAPLPKPAAAQQLPHSATPSTTPVVAAPRPAAPPLNLADPAQAAARQDSAAPLMAKLAAIVTAAAPSLPRPVIEVALKVLANRVDLNRGAPDARTLEAAVSNAGVLLTPPGRNGLADGKSALLALRSTLLAFLGGDTGVPISAAERPAPPLKGEAPRSPMPQVALPGAETGDLETARTLLGQTESALSRLKLLQSASQPADARPDASAPRNELRVEIPMLLGAENGILQLMVERDARHKRESERQRGWRMRFAMNFTATGEVGADIALLGQAASIAIWAADPDTADALDHMLPELAPAIQRHGLELNSLRVRRGAPQQARTAPGRLLDSAR